jgi:hypothetical protein
VRRPVGWARGQREGVLRILAAVEVARLDRGRGEDGHGGDGRGKGRRRLQRAW